MQNVFCVNIGTKGRKRRKLKAIWDLPTGKRIVVKSNDLDQPIGKEATHLGNFLGTIARNGSLCSLSYKDWRLLIGEKDKLTNERINLKAILDQVKVNCSTLSFSKNKYLLYCSLNIM
jgi:hypothetical protein